MSKKFKFQLNGMTFELPNKHLQTTDWSGEKLKNPTIRINQAAGAALCKQYVKKMYPEVVVSVSSESFSMGNSVNVYISDAVGNEVRKGIIEDVQDFGNQFVYGKFNGMIDMYESRPTIESTDGGTKLDAGVKYLTVNNYPKFCSVPDICRMIEGMTIKAEYVFGNVSLEKAIENIKGYGATQNNINKAITLLNK